jgi:LPXTG-motif cell wall-anchored protein
MKMPKLRTILSVIICFGFLITFRTYVNAVDGTIEKNVSRNANSTEVIDLYANPETDSDTVAMFRLTFENAEILKFSPQGIALPACENLDYIYNNQFCADFAQVEPFKKGDFLGTITVRWGDQAQTASIIKNEENGYYNGADISIQTEPFIETNIFGAATPKTDNTRVFAAIFLGFGLVLITGGSFVLIKSKKKKNSK